MEGLPAVIWLGYGVHGNEISSPDAALLTAYHLLAARNDKMVEQILERVLVLIDPMQNPDGRDRFIGNFEQARGLEPDASPLAAGRSYAQAFGSTSVSRLKQWAGGGGTLIGFAGAVGFLAGPSVGLLGVARENAFTQAPPAGKTEKPEASVPGKLLLTQADHRKQLANKPLLVVQPEGKGTVIGFTADPNYRAYLDALSERGVPRTRPRPSRGIGGIGLARWAKAEAAAIQWNQEYAREQHSPGHQIHCAPVFPLSPVRHSL